MKIALLYLAAVSFIAALITIYDKIAAKRYPKSRVPENTLLFVGFIGGAAAEFLVMRIIRHKTRHKKFMLGLPLFIVLQAALIIALHFLVFKI